MQTNLTISKLTHKKNGAIFGVTLKNRLQGILLKCLSQKLVRYLFISSTKNEYLLQKFFTDMANLHSLLSDQELQVLNEKKADSGSDLED